MRSWLPHPLMSVVLLVVWLLLNDSASPGHLVLGTVLGVMIPLFSQRFWSHAVDVRRPVAAFKLAAIVSWDVVTASIAVARRVVAGGAPDAAFIRVPLEPLNDYALATLANIISLTPGTVSAEVEPDRRHLVVHVLELDDEAALIEEIKTRYEARVMEILP